ncbi:MAG: exosortase/archaeosortase family protein [Chloroflexi bacterium]|nr:exosortase/archaeosortase family protein [Chloroflexota bacterium]
MNRKPSSLESGRNAGPYWGLAFCLLAVVFYPTLVWLVNTWLSSPYYSHGLLIPAIAAWCAWRLSREHREKPQDALGEGLAALGVSLGVHLFALGRQRHLLSSLALVLSLAGLVMTIGGISGLKRHSFPLAFLLFMIPLPWMDSWAPVLARGVAHWAAVLARPLGIQATVEGARIGLAGGAMTVGAPCSGLNSLVALMALAALYAFLVRGPLWKRALLLLFSPFIALAVNLTRIWLLLLLGHYAGVDAALRYFHDWSGLLLFALALGLLMLAGRGLGCVGIRSDI